MKRRDPLTILSGGDPEWRKRWLSGLAKVGRSPVFARRERGFSPFDVTHVLAVRLVGKWSSWVGWAVLRVKGGRFLVIEIEDGRDPRFDFSGSLRAAVNREEVTDLLADPDLRVSTRWLRDPFRAAAALAALGAAP